VHVLRGKIVEKAYVPDKPEGMSIRQAAQRPEGVKVNINERVFRSGSTMTIGSPYLHDVFGASDQKRADVSVHAYWPPLKEMGYYKFTAKDRIKWDGRWKEGEVDPDAERRHALHFGCWHGDLADLPTKPRTPKIKVQRDAEGSWTITKQFDEES
jgi:hypothetical protein